MPAIGLSAKGRNALRQNRLDGQSVAAEHRRILSLVEFEGHSEVVRGFLRRYPDAMIDRWLAELAQLGLIEPASPAPEADLRFTGAGAVPLPPLLREDEKRLDEETWKASNLLNASGAYVARDRAKNRAFARRDGGQTGILIVEDDPDQLALAVRRVRASGYATSQADSAHALREALLKEAAPDLLLLDVVLPDGDGFDILGHLRRHPRFCLLPVVMLTVKGDPSDIHRGIALEADGYVTKPYSEEILAQTIAQVMGSSR